MKPLIVAATTFEIQAIIPLLEQKQIPYLITGVGMTATAYALGKTLALDSSISLVINVGIAGSFDREINLGEVVSIYADSFYELGAEDADDFIFRTGIKLFSFSEMATSRALKGRTRMDVEIIFIQD